MLRLVCVGPAGAEPGVRNSDGRELGSSAGRVVVMWWLTIGLAVAAALEAVGLTVMAVRIRLLRRRYDRLARSLAPASTTSTVVVGAHKAVRAAVTVAARLRAGGMSELLNASLDDLTRWAAEDRSAIARVATPEGVVTFVFTDIVDSTSTNEALGDRAWVRVLAAHERLVRSHVDRNGGHIVKAQGDGFMIVFGAPATAVVAAQQIQGSLERRSSRTLRATPLQVRIGMHTGTAVTRDGDYFGRNVAVAARIAALAEGGQILVSDQTWEALPDPAAVGSTATRNATLKGLTGEYLLHEIRW